ncbi:MAG: proton-conducting transporter membrane subunit, partial [Candidatus Cloacimonas sp.]|nr:proton-conducting transporter membrane subunit [Candidatus Cloacimonas sp.]
MIAYGAIIILVALVAALLKRSALFTFLGAVASFFMGYGYAVVLFSGKIQSYVLSLPGITGIAELTIDPLGAFFGLIFSFGFPLGLLYGHHYLKAHPAKGIASHQLWLGLMILSMHLVLLLRNSLLFMLVWELMSLASFFAIILERENRETVASALYYFVMMHIGAAVLLSGFAWQYWQTGSLNFGTQAISGWAKWLLLIGFSFKAGFFPFYSWLPKAHPVAPSHLSGMMSGLMIKTGIFGIIFVLTKAQWQAYEVYILLAIALITAFNGVIHALAETNIKRALAYSSIENIGIIGIGLSFWQLGLIFGNPVMAALGFAGALMHTLNHSLFKPLLFYLSGNVLVSTHSLDSDSLGGLGKRMPRTAVLFLCGTAAISALPLLNGFISEFGIFLSILSGFKPSNLGSTLSSVVAGAIFAFVSALALIAFTKLYSIVFSGEPRTPNAAQATEVTRGMLISPMLLAVACFVLGIFGNLGLQLAKPLAVGFGIDVWLLDSFSHSLNGISVVLLLLLFAFAVLYFLKTKICSCTSAPTWGCGYAKPNSR